jgi:hypothetical protein
MIRLGYKIVRGTILQYSMINRVSVSGGDEISFTKMGARNVISAEKGKSA